MSIYFYDYNHLCTCDLRDLKEQRSEFKQKIKKRLQSNNLVEWQKLLVS